VEDVSSATLDANGQAILAFAADLRNLSRTAALVDEVAEMHDSGRWRRYGTAQAVEEWRECEFDYFLIACDVAYEDIGNVLAWNKRGKELAPAMVSDDKTKRRPLEAASAAWHSPTGETLADRAARRGWVNGRGVLRRPPVPARALSHLKNGVTKDEHARQQRQAQIPRGRQKEIERRLEVLSDGLSDIELRFARDQLASRITHRKPQPPAGGDTASPSPR
jgi:hypothetical protein